MDDTQFIATLALYRHLLELRNDRVDARTVIEESLPMLLDACRADQVQLELGDGPYEHRLVRTGCLAHDPPVAFVARARTERRTFALTADHPTMCTPVDPRSPIGVICVSGPHAFTEVERDVLEVFARELAACAAVLLIGNPLSLKDATTLFQRRCILEELRRHRGNVQATARALGMARSSLYSLIAHHGLQSF
jgi:hypothetical protein